MTQRPGTYMRIPVGPHTDGCVFVCLFVCVCVRVCVALSSGKGHTSLFVLMSCQFFGGQSCIEEDEIVRDEPPGPAGAHCFGTVRRLKL